MNVNKMITELKKIMNNTELKFRYTRTVLSSQIEILSELNENSDLAKCINTLEQQIEGSKGYKYTLTVISAKIEILQKLQKMQVIV